MSANSATLWDVLHRLDSSDLSLIIGLFLFFTTIAIVIVAAGIARTIYAIHKSRLEDALKRELVDRGYSVDEIARIVEASATRRPGANRLPDDARQTIPNKTPAGAS